MDSNEADIWGVEKKLRQLEHIPENGKYGYPFLYVPKHQSIVLCYSKFSFLRIRYG